MAPAHPHATGVAVYPALLQGNTAIYGHPSCVWIARELIKGAYYAFG